MTNVGSSQSSLSYGGFGGQNRHRIVQRRPQFLDIECKLLPDSVPLTSLKASDRTQSQTLVRAPSAIISTLHMSNDMRRQNTSVQDPYTSQRPLLPRVHSTMSVICFEEHPSSATGRLDHSIGNGISTAPVPSQAVRTRVRLLWSYSGETSMAI